MNEPYHTYEWVMSHIWMSHVTRMNESRHTYERWNMIQIKAYERVMSHIWMSHVTHMNESCHTYERVMSHIWALKHDPNQSTWSKSKSTQRPKQYNNESNNDLKNDESNPTKKKHLVNIKKHAKAQTIQLSITSYPQRRSADDLKNNEIDLNQKMTSDWSLKSPRKQRESDSILPSSVERRWLEKHCKYQRFFKKNAPDRRLEIPQRQKQSNWILTSAVVRRARASGSTVADESPAANFQTGAKDGWCRPDLRDKYQHTREKRGRVADRFDADIFFFLKLIANDDGHLIDLWDKYGVATVSRIDSIICLFCRISSLL